MGGGGALRKRSWEDSQEVVRPIGGQVPQRRQLQVVPSMIIEPAESPIFISSRKTNKTGAGADKLQRGLGRLELKPSLAQQTGSLSPTSTHQHHTTKNTIQVAHGCLLLPVMMAAWWYWTKRKARKVLRRLHLMAPPAAGNSMDEDDEDGVDISLAYYQQQQYSNTANSNSSSWDGVNDPHHHNHFHSWDDVQHGSSSNQSGAVRLVQWFKGRGGKTTRSRRRVHANTLQNLRQGPSCQTPEEDDASENSSDAPAELVLARGRRQAAAVLARSKRKQSIGTSAIHVGILDGSENEEPTWRCIQDTMGEGFCTIPNHPSSSSTTSSNGGMDMNGRTPQQNDLHHHQQQQQTASVAVTDTVVDGVVTNGGTIAPDTIL